MERFPSRAFRFLLSRVSCRVIVADPADSSVLPAGQEGAIAAPAEAAQSTKHTGDLLRRFKEYATSVKEGMKAEPPPLTEEETALRNEKIRVDDFQEKLIHASRKVCVHMYWCPCMCRSKGKRLEYREDPGLITARAYGSLFRHSLRTGPSFNRHLCSTLMSHHWAVL